MRLVKDMLTYVCHAHADIGVEKTDALASSSLSFPPCPSLCECVCGV